MIDLVYLLVIYAIFFAITSLFLFFNLYHILRFGLNSNLTYIIATGYILLYALILGLTFAIFTTVDWSQDLELGHIFSNSLPLQ